MAAPREQPYLAACRLPQAWQDQAAWRILDTDFGDGSRFFSTWQAWVEDPRRARLLHYVAITPSAPEHDALLRVMAAFPALSGQGGELGRQWFGMLDGFQRLVLQYGAVLLTVCIGPMREILREQRFLADSVYLDAAVGPTAGATWDRWQVKALARLCRRGAGLAMRHALSALQQELGEAGFVLETAPHAAGPAQPPAAAAPLLRGYYQPFWTSAATRHAWRAPAAVASSCLVVGAGLAGAAAAAALARRGWSVTVLDAAPGPASGASGLPVGLLAPQVSRDDNARSRLARAGIRLTRQSCEQRLQIGVDWAWPGVLELRPDPYAALPAAWPAAGRQWSDPTPVEVATTGQHIGVGLTRQTASIWHASAGWVKPARLVQACLEQAGVRFVGNSAVQSIARLEDEWVLRDAGGRCLGRAPHLVLASACNTAYLVDAAMTALCRPGPTGTRLAPMSSVDGQLTWALQAHGRQETLPACPINGHGSFMANIPMGVGFAWFAGATYETGHRSIDGEAAGNQENLLRRRQLLDAFSGPSEQAFKDDLPRVWRGTRCTTVDRLPAAGPVDDGSRPLLWVSTGMGSRGLTYATLCAELLAAQLGAEPLPIEASLLKSLSATRARLLAPGLAPAARRIR